MVISTEPDPGPSAGTKRSTACLSKRQIECLRGVADHLDSQQIGARLGISPHTVDGHIATAVKTLGARSRRDAIRFLPTDAGHGQSIIGEFPPVAATHGSESPPVPAAVHEPRTTFARLDTPLPRAGSQRNDRVGNPIITIALITAIALGLAILLLASEPLAQSAERLANLIQPFHR